MSTFQVQARRIRAIETHHNANALELAVIDDFRSCVRKGAHQAGDLVVYLPEAAVLPEWVLRKVGLWDEAQNKGKCAGEAGNRVKAVTLRGILSQGIVFPLEPTADKRWRLELPDGRGFIIEEGIDVAELMGITKFKPEIPAELMGQCFDGGIENLLNFDIENIKAGYAKGDISVSFIDAFTEGEEVAMHEKLHGTFTGFMLLPEGHEIPGEGRVLVFSKGTAQDAMAFKLSPEAAEKNVYVKAYYHFNMEARLHQLAAMLATRERAKNKPVFILGETFGSASKQDLKYGADMDFRVFDLGFGGRSDKVYLNDLEVDEYTHFLGLKRVPLVYRGPFSKAALEQHTSGKETYSGKQLHIREGVVVRPARERRHDAFGRVVLKSVSPQYVVRAGGTEYQ